jgi:hypothetical protein
MERAILVCVSAASFQALAAGHAEISQASKELKEARAVLSE